VSSQLLVVGERSINDLDDVSSDLKKNILKKWIKIKDNKGNINSSLIEFLGGEASLISRLSEKVKNFYFYQLSSFQRTNNTASPELSVYDKSQLIISHALKHNMLIPPFNHLSRLPNGNYPLRPLDNTLAAVWDFYVTSNRGVADYIDAYNIVTQAIPQTGGIVMGLPVPVVPSAPPLAVSIN
jgi:hypothetical protein